MSAQRNNYVDARGYIVVWFPEHPSVADKKYKSIREHVLVAEKVLGYVLPKGVVVHHIDENKSNNRPDNLLVCTKAYHNFLHRRMRAYAETGNANSLVCVRCGKYDDPENLYVSPQHLQKGTRAWHRHCDRLHQRERAAQKNIQREARL